MTKLITVEISDSVGVITVNRPEVLNALNIETLAELSKTFANMSGNPAVRAIILTGAGDRAFVSGADIARMLKMDAKEADEFAKAGHNCMRSIEDCAKPVIAAVNGYALGGGTEIAISCDIIIASEKAKFGLPETKLGLYPGFGGTQRLPRLIGAMRAKELIFSGRIIDSETAFEWGLVNKVVPPNELLNEAKKLGIEIAANGPVAVSTAKYLINTGLCMMLPDGLKKELECFSKLFKTEDRIEGLSAFLEKRKPVFKG